MRTSDLETSSSLSPALSSKLTLLESRKKCCYFRSSSYAGIFFFFFSVESLSICFLGCVRISWVHVVMSDLPVFSDSAAFPALTAASLAWEVLWG